uniref:Uncharacterized protein n=1 Tax=Engystomops pustulosus TaxID=76066 RepID=A0AAV6YYL4_ENGPU|nr:hypothetical protein GDO81_019532 [Engystomops pustulosus]
MSGLGVGEIWKHLMAVGYQHISVLLLSKMYIGKGLSGANSISPFSISKKSTAILPPWPARHKSIRATRSQDGIIQVILLCRARSSKFLINLA